MKKAIIIGIGQDRGLGAQLSKRFAKEGLHVFLASRTQSNLDSLVSRIEAECGKATAFCTDSTDEEQVMVNLAPRAYPSDHPSSFLSFTLLPVSGIRP